MSDVQYRSQLSENRFTARIICKIASRRRDLEILAGECGLQIAPDQIDIFNRPTSPAKGADECILLDFPSISDRPPTEITNLSSYISSSSADALVWTDMDCVDQAFADLPAEKCHFLIDPNPAEAMLLLTGATRRGIMNQLHDTSRDDGYQELHKISSELADVVRTLTQFTGTAAKDAEGLAGNHVTSSIASDAPVSFRPASPAAMQPLVPESGIRASDLRKII